MVADYSLQSIKASDIIGQLHNKLVRHNIMDIIDSIDRYYKKKGIHSLQFTCCHKHECSLNSRNFTGPKSTFVPDKYSESYPRIAFLSLDSGDSLSDPKERTPHAVRRQEQIACVVEELPKGLHWYETHYWAQQVYNAISSNHITLEETKNYFCHLNSAKCCQNKRHSKEADSILFQNCRQYLPEELKLISPHILISQGNRAREAITEIFTIKDKLYENVYLISPDKFLWVHTYHPGSRDYYRNQKKDLDNIARVLRDSISYV